MKVLVINRKEVYELLQMQICIEVVRHSLMTLAGGGGFNPLRSIMRFPDGTGLLGMMPAYLANLKTTGMKLITVMPGNHGSRYDSHQGFVILFEMVHGCPVAIVDASSVTAIRTAAVSAVATGELARQDSKSLAILGSGVQAVTHLEAMLEVRDINNVRVWSRNKTHARTFVEQARDRYAIGIDAVRTAREAVTAADIICTVTSSPEPVLKGQWLTVGTHINAVGACVRTCRELDTEAVLKSRLYVDLIESAQNEAGDFLMPRQEGVLGDDHILGELGDVMSGKVRGRTSRDEITLFKGLGIGIEDLAVADYVYTQAMKNNAGFSIDL